MLKKDIENRIIKKDYSNFQFVSYDLFIKKFNLKVKHIWFKFNQNLPKIRVPSSGT
jgi:hypothetical protein